MRDPVFRLSIYRLEINVNYMFNPIILINVSDEYLSANDIYFKPSSSWVFIEIIIIKQICDVICEKGPYCGRNIIGPDQTPRMMRGV